MVLYNTGVDFLENVHVTEVEPVVAFYREGWRVGLHSLWGSVIFYKVVPEIQVQCVKSSDVFYTYLINGCACLTIWRWLVLLIRFLICFLEFLRQCLTLYPRLVLNSFHSSSWLQLRILWLSLASSVSLLPVLTTTPGLA